MSQTEQLYCLDHLFRNSYGSLVASIVRQFGIQHIDLIEDAVQRSMLQAVTHWPLSSVPKNPSGWLYQVAFRCVLSTLRDNTRRQIILSAEVIPALEDAEHKPLATFDSELSDSLLRMLFLACHESIPIESQLVFTLKSLCGFSVKEIGIRLFITEANVYKRFARAKNVLMQQDFRIDEVDKLQVKARMPAVHKVLYLVFTEGYMSSDKDMLVRHDLCQEATRLTCLLAEHPWGNEPETFALLALFNFNLARMKTRENQAGLVLLEDQQRHLWDKQKIAQALVYLDRSTQGESISRYHIEASIAAEHCLAKCYHETRWDNIISAYILLEKISPSPLHILNRALAVAEHHDAKAGLQVLNEMNIPTWLERSYHWYAVLADLQYRTNDNQRASQNLQKAMELAPTEGIKDLLGKRMARY